MSRERPAFWINRVMGLLDIVDGVLTFFGGVRYAKFGLRFAAWDAKRTVRRNLERRQG